MEGEIYLSNHPKDKRNGKNLKNINLVPIEYVLLENFSINFKKSLLPKSALLTIRQIKFPQNLTFSTIRQIKFPPNLIFSATRQIKFHLKNNF